MKMTKDIVFGDNFERASYNLVNPGLSKEVEQHEKTMADIYIASMTYQLPRTNLQDIKPNAVKDAFKEQLNNNLEPYKDQAFQNHLAKARTKSKKKLDGYNHPLTLTTPELSEADK